MAKSIDTAFISSTANQITKLNNELSSILQNSKASVQSLGAHWTGKAATETISAFDRFAATYYSKYEEMLNNYSTFLHTYADEGYSQTEIKNASKSERI